MHISLRAHLVAITALREKIKAYRIIIKQFFTFACGALLTRSITLILAPITMQILTPADYGLLALANSFVSIITAFLGLGLRQMLPLHYFHLQQNERTALIADIICLYLCISMPIFVAMTCTLSHINRYLFLGQASTELLLLSIVISFLYFFVELLYQLLQYHRQAIQLTVLQSGVALLTIILNLFFLIQMQWGVCSIFWGQAVSMGLVCILGLLHKKDYIPHLHAFNIRRALLATKQYLALGIPFIPGMLLGLMLASTDRWVLAYAADLHMVGIYSIASTLAQLTNMIAFYAITGSYMPYKLNQFAQYPEQIIACEQENKRVMWFSMATGFVLLSGGFALCRPIFYWFLPPIYHEAISYMYLLLIGSIFLLGTYFLNCLLQFKQKSLFLGLVLCLPASLNLILNMLLVPYFGLYGCVLATLISYISYFLITLWYNVHVLKMDPSIHASLLRSDAHSGRAENVKLL